MPPMTIGNLFTGQLVKLGATKTDDKDALARWSHDAEYYRQMHFEPARPRPAAYYEERDKKEDEHRHDSARFAIRTLADDKFIGITGLWMQWNHQTAWFWIGIGEADYRSKGYGTDATRLVVDYAFRELGLFRVQLGVFGYNTRARRTYEKVGFIHEGTQRHALYRDGQRWDMDVMAILRPEWEARREQAAQAQPVLEIPEAVLS